MKFHNFSIPVLAALFVTVAVESCNDSGTIGSSLLGDQVEIIVDSSFTVSGHSVVIPSIRPGTSDQLLGDINVDGFGRVRSNAVFQLLPATEFDTTYTAANVDSVFLNFRYTPGSFIGDSIVPMGLTVYPLTRQLPATLDNNFDPAGYYDPNNFYGSVVYNTSSLGSDSIAELTTRTLAVKLPLEFGRSLFSEFETNPSNFANGAVFAENVFPGFYAQTTFGSGRLTHISRTTMTMHLRRIDEIEDAESEELSRDTVDAVHEYFLVSPEVLNNNNIKVELAPELTALVEEGHTVIASPGVYEVNMRFPAPEIIDAFKNGSAGLTTLNTVTMTIPTDSINSEHGVGPLPYILLVLTKDRDDFFASNMLPDNETSFYATFDESTGSYSFTGLGAYINMLMEKESIEEEDYTFSIVPVEVNFELDMTSYYSQRYIVSEVIPYYISPSASDLRLDEANITLTYSRQRTLR